MGDDVRDDSAGKALIDGIKHLYHVISHFLSHSLTECRTPRTITLTLFPPLPCPLSSTRSPQRFPPHSQTTPTRLHSSRATSISCRLRSAPYAPWHKKRSTLCAFSLSPRLDSEPSSTFSSTDEDLCDPAKVPTSPVRASHMQLVVSVSPLPYSRVTIYPRSPQRVLQR